MIDRDFWLGRSVFITGHTGFKGSWLCLWLHAMGANVTGYALPPHTKPSMFELCGLDELVTTVYGDIRNKKALCEALLKAKPDVVIHMAAQPLVRASYDIPVETYEVNVMGTVNLLEAVRELRSTGHVVPAVINVTTDKCYENREWAWGYREYEPMGGYDPYSNSKACSELVTSAYRSSFFHPEQHAKHGIALASARAGNVIGGGDWSKDRLIPDIISSLIKGDKVDIRNPLAIRPWQHVLEPLGGYLLLAQRLAEGGARYASGWNFGPNDADARNVLSIVQLMCRSWGKDASYALDTTEQPHESQYLKLDCSKAKQELGWQPVWSVEQAVTKIVEWEQLHQSGQSMRAVSLEQIETYMRDSHVS